MYLVNTFTHVQHARVDVRVQAHVHAHAHALARTSTHDKNRFYSFVSVTMKFPSSVMVVLNQQPGASLISLFPLRCRTLLPSLFEWQPVARTRFPEQKFSLLLARILCRSQPVTLLHSMTTKPTWVWVYPLWTGILTGTHLTLSRHYWVGI